MKPFMEYILMVQNNRNSRQMHPSSLSSVVHFLIDFIMVEFAYLD